MYGRDPFDCFQFQDHGIFYDEIDAVAAIELDALVFNWDGNLTFKSQAA